MMMSTEIRNEIREKVRRIRSIISSIILVGLIWGIWMYVAYGSGTNAYYGIKHLIMPAQVKCTVEQVEEGEFDVLIINKETNEGTFYKGLQELNVSNVLKNFPKGKYFVVSNARVIEDSRLIKISEIPSEWKEFISANVIKKDVVIDWISIPVSRESSWKLSQYTSVNE